MYLTHCNPVYFTEQLIGLICDPLGLSYNLRIILPPQLERA